ncbi:MAG: DUF2179 domain-containing protein [Mycoplasmataceae bacterium]|nr:DUF2179 domain-containing protein [Mycoplasmataceae bacterium]
MKETLAKNKSGTVKTLRLSFSKKMFLLTSATILISFASLYFIVYAGIFSPGMGGLSQGFAYSLWDILQRANPSDTHLGMTFLQFKIAFFYLVYWIINIPVFYFTFKKFGKSFLFYSTYTLFLSAIIATGLSFSSIGSLSFIGSINPEKIQSYTLENPELAKTFKFVIYILMAIIAGLLYGLGVGIVFSVGACTMGFDPIARYQARTKGVEIGKIFFVFSLVVSLFWISSEYFINNIGMAGTPIPSDGPYIMGETNGTEYLGVSFYGYISAVIFSPKLIATCVFLFTYSAVVSAMYPSSRKYIIEVISAKTSKISEYFNLINYHRSHTLVEARGGYLGKHLEILKMTINAEELIDVIEDVSKIDNNAFIQVYEAKKIFGPHVWTPRTKEDKKHDAELYRLRDHDRKRIRKHLDNSAKQEKEKENSSRFKFLDYWKKENKRLTKRVPPEPKLGDELVQELLDKQDKNKPKKTKDE